MQTDPRPHPRPAVPDPTLQDELGERARPMSVSYGIVGAVLGLGALGFILDRWLESTPWLMLGGLFLGLAIGFYSLRRFIATQ
jgi:F0F1-type ATP synthase assembly protein I